MQDVMDASGIEDLPMDLTSARCRFQQKLSASGEAATNSHPKFVAPAAPEMFHPTLYRC